MIHRNIVKDKPVREMEAVRLATVEVEPSAKLLPEPRCRVPTHPAKTLATAVVRLFDLLT